MQIYSKTDIGKRRKENQDSCTYKVISDDCLYAIVCDGMGGAKGGSVASLTATEVISSYFDKYYTEATNKKDIPAIMVSALELANDEIYIQGATEELYGMGTTCDVVIICSRKVHCAHVGDSRIYLIRDGSIRQLTEDHSMVQEMVNRGELTPEQAQHHPNKNFITRALGVIAQVNVDYIESDFKKDDIILMCSDGLSNLVENEEMVRILKEYSPSDVTEQLVSLANERGGSDNITVTVIFEKGETDG